MRASTHRSEGGFTLVETLAAITVFALMTVGIVPLIASSLRGAALARSFTVGKNLATEAMERVRGFPYYDTAPNRDVLDMYFPNLSTGYNAGTQTFVTICTATSSSPAASAGRACPPEHADGTAKIPGGYTVNFQAQFVRPTTAVPETYTVLTPIAGYNANVAGSSIPPSQLLRVTIGVEWLQGGLTKRFQLTSLLGDRKLAPDKARAEGTVDYTLQVLASFQEASGRESSMQALVGRTQSRVEIRNFATADTNASAGRVSVTQGEFLSDAGATLSEVAGAESTRHAPPDLDPVPPTTAAAQTVTNPLLGTQIAELGASAVNDSSPTPTVKIPTELPSAANNFAFTGGVGEEDSFWANNQADFSGGGVLALKPASHIVSVRRVGSNRFKGNTSALATAVTPAGSRKVEAKAHAEFAKFLLMPTTFITHLDEAVVVITDFVADLTCTARGSAGAATVTGTWSATLKYWKDNVPDELDLGSYVTVPLSGSVGGSGTDPLQAVSAANPVVLDLPGSDVHLFDDPASGKVGYLTSWSSTPTIGSETSATLASGAMAAAINIVTAKTNPTNAESQMAISIGKLSCRAVDLRG